MRMSMLRFTRLTNAFSKKVEYDLYAVALHFMHYNYCRPHQTHTRARAAVIPVEECRDFVTDRSTRALRTG